MHTRKAKITTDIDPIRLPYTIPNTHVIIHLWNRPTSGVFPPIAWTVFLKHPRRRPVIDKEKTYYLQIVGWDPNDYYDNPNQLTITEAQLETDKFLEHMQIGRQISIPIIGIDTISSTDGSLSGIQMPEGTHGGYKLSWWDDGPPEWQPLTHWFGEFTEYLTSIEADME